MIKRNLYIFLVLLSVFTLGLSCNTSSPTSSTANTTTGGTNLGTTGGTTGTTGTNTGGTTTGTITDTTKTTDTTVTQPQEQIVYITDTGSKFHRDGCRYLSKSKIAITRKNAVSQGYGPCSVCNP